MAIELITGKAGTPHIDSADIGAFQAYTLGDGVYILHGLEAAIATANSVTVNAGDAMAEGRHFRLVGAGQTLNIDSGQSGYKRNDVIAVHYSKDGAGIESVELVIVKGTPATANQVDPAMPSAGSVLDGATQAYWPLYRVTVDGLTPQAPVMVAEEIKNGVVTLFESQANPRAASAIGSASTTKQLAESVLNFANVYICMRPWRSETGGAPGERYAFAVTGPEIAAQIQAADGSTWGKVRKLHMADGYNDLLSEVSFNDSGTSISFNGVKKAGLWDATCLVGVYGYGRVE